MKITDIPVTPKLLFLFSCLLCSFYQPAFAIDCESPASDCSQSNSQIYAVAHEYGPKAEKVIFRINIPAWSPAEFVSDSGWNGDYNGFFYQVNTLQNGEITNTHIFVPFNGIHIGIDRLPKMPAFHMFPGIEIIGANTGLEIKACASNYSGSADKPDCSELFWSNTYSALPSPVVFESQPFGAFISIYTLINAKIEVADNGVYAASLILDIPPSFRPQQLQLLYDHTLFFQHGTGNHYTNDIHKQGVGILEFDEATYLDVKDHLFHTRYGNGLAIEEADGPSKRLFFYANEMESEIKIGISSIFDLEGQCTGFITGIGSNNDNCIDNYFNLTPSFGLVSTLTVSDWKPEVNSAASHPAGLIRQRSIELDLTAASEDNKAICDEVLNPLARYPSEDDEAFRPPNFVISNQDWNTDFPIGLYYVIDSGFGNCASQAPFCQNTNDYFAYIPHYFSANGNFGSLNGGSTNAEIIAGLRLADQYAIGTINEVDNNHLTFFDRCGYGHEYLETNNFNARKNLPPAPENRNTLNFSINNQINDRPIVYAKECCASWYQQNEQANQAVYEPPHQLDNNFGMYVANGKSVPYQTLFSREATVTYDAVSGDPLFKLYTDIKEPALFACHEAQDSVKIVPENNTIQLVLGETGEQSLRCSNNVMLCPFGMKTAFAGSQISCTTDESTFLLGLDQWQEQLDTAAIQLRAWGGSGSSGIGPGGLGGAEGFAMTVTETNELPSSLFLYLGQGNDELGTGGSSTILSASPLSSYGSETAENETQPENRDILLIAAGGGAGGSQNAETNGRKGGNGGVAISNSSTIFSFPVSAPGQNGQGSSGGAGGNQNLLGHSNSSEAGFGIGGLGGGGVGWLTNGALIPPTASASSWQAGNGAQTNSTGGGGGFGGGVSPNLAHDGAGGGGSWSAANKAFDATAPSFKLRSPVPGQGALQFAYVSPPCTIFEHSTGPTVRCIYHESIEGLDIQNLAEALFGADVSDDLPIYVEAWGGNGGNGTGYKTYLPKNGEGGIGGYARTNTSLLNITEYTGNELNIYTGAKGLSGTQLQNGPTLQAVGGNGGTSTLVSGLKLSALEADNQISNPRDSKIVLISAGGGGGGSLLNGGYGGYGGQGAIAIADTSQDRSCGGFPGNPASSPVNPTPDDAIEGLGGNGGSGLCDSNRAGHAGNGGSNGGKDGMDFLGGFGGQKIQLSNSTSGWVNNSVSFWSSGNGGGSSTSGGGGGAGFGGGGAAGNATSGELRDGGGGGGGGSWALQAYTKESEAPVLGNKYSPNHLGAGAVALTFDICSVDPDSYFCSENPFFVRLDQNINLYFDEAEHQIRMVITGDENFNVNLLDSRRVSFGFASVRPIPADFEPKDFNQDGYKDIEIRFQVDANFQLNEMFTRERGFTTFNFNSVHCIYGGLKDGTPLIGCARPNKFYRFRNSNNLKRY